MIDALVYLFLTCLFVITTSIIIHNSYVLSIDVLHLHALYRLRCKARNEIFSKKHDESTVFAKWRSFCDVFAEMLTTDYCVSVLMRVFDTFEAFWQAYFGSQTTLPFEVWTIAHIAHTDDQAYAQAKTAGQDKLGFQPTMFTLADPLAQRHETAIVKDLSTAAVAALSQQYQQRFMGQLPARFGLLHADKASGDAVYDSWEAFAAAWLISADGQDLLTYNLPLVFDHVSDLEYWGWQQKEFDPCGTQRLIITIFQYRTGHFADIFITNVNDTEMARIALLAQSKIGFAADRIFAWQH